MHLKKLRIDEAVLPYMNGDGLGDRPAHFRGVVRAVFRKNRAVYAGPLPPNPSWQEVFEAFDRLLIEAGEERSLDLSGVVRDGDMLRPLWIR